MSAIAVTFYICLAGLWGAPVSGASMNPGRSLGPALVLGDFTSWWAYLLGPIIGAGLAVGGAFILRGRGGGYYGKRAAEGTLGWVWAPGPVHDPDALRTKLEAAANATQASTPPSGH